MTKRTPVILALAALAALASAALSTTSRAQDAERTVNLSPGCNVVTLTFADGTDAATLATAVSPPGALETVWRLDNATGSFQAYMPQAPQASDLTSVNLLDAVFVCVDGSSSIAPPSISMPAVSPDPSGATFAIDLAPGCNAVGLSFPDATTPSQVGDAVTPPGAFESIWRHDAAQGSFQAYVAAAPQASDLTSLQFLDAVFVCASEQAILDLPAVTEPEPGAVAAPPTDIRFVMEAAVPQVVDLPMGFRAVYEGFESYGGPGLLYEYFIAYLSTLDYQMEAPVFAGFYLGICDTVANATTTMNEYTARSAEEWKAELEPRFGGSLGLEIGSLTIQEVEPLAAIGEEAVWQRFRIQVRPVKTNEMFAPMAVDLITIRRDRIVGQLEIDWWAGPPGPRFIPENLAKKMDAGMQEAMPEFLAAIP